MQHRANMALIGLVVGLSIPAVRRRRGETLRRYQACYREIPSAGQQYFSSPCVAMNLRVLGLAGISVVQLESALGPANECFDQDVDGQKKYPQSKTCPLPAWTFYDLWKGSLGGGPILACSTTGGNICRIVSWMMTA
jgi:hypothetical protein